MELMSVYHWPLVLVSVLSGMVSSFVAISIVPRMYAAQSSARAWIWVVAFGLSLGTGICTMHFTAILALQLTIPITFDLLGTILSLLVAIVVSALAISPLRLAGALGWREPRTLLMGCMMGLGIASMHYLGMMALRINANMQHDGWVVLVAVLIAIVASSAALVIAHQLRDVRVFSLLQSKLIAAILMGLGVSMMHYIAMMGTHFMPVEIWQTFESTMSPLVLAGFLVGIACLIQSALFVAAIMDESTSLSHVAALEMEQRANVHQVLSEMLSIGLTKQSLAKKMEAALDILLNLHWLKVQHAGSIFIAPLGSKRLHMVAQRNLSAVLQERCKVMDFGYCLCGMAASTQKLVYKSCVDHAHDVQHEGMLPHGHYCVPVTSEGETLAVVNLYLKDGHPISDDEVQFLQLAADTLAVMIQHHHTADHAQKISTAIDQAGEAMMIANVSGEIEYVNRAFTTITGYSLEESVGQRTSLLRSGEQDEPFYQELWRKITAGQVWSGEVVERRKDGSFYPAHLTVSPSRDSHGHITHYIGIHEDLSDYKQMESQFRQAQKMEAVGTLVGGIAHDFNNMLAAITGNTFLAKRHLQNPADMARHLGVIEQVSERAAAMIQKLLTFSRKNMVSMKRLSLPDFVRETLPLLRSSVPENIHLDAYVCEPLFVLADNTLLHQALMNLVINARDAVEGIAGVKQIEITVEPFQQKVTAVKNHLELKAGNYVLVRVRDNGVGIASEHLDHMFEPFFTTKEQGKGTGLGLGLAMVYGAMKSHAGFIDVESEVGVGTVFSLYFPLLEALTDELLPEAVSQPVHEAQGEWVLVVDDEPDVRETTAEVLEILGYQVLQAKDGVDGLRKFQEHPHEISLAVLDVVMPNMGGVALAKKMREVRADLPVIFLTGYDKEHLLQDGIQDGMGVKQGEVLSKPVNFDLLSHHLQALIKG